MKLYDEHDGKNLMNGFGEEVLLELVRVCKGVNICLFCSKRQIPWLTRFFCEKHGCGLEVIVWEKTNPVPLCSNKWLNDKELCLFFRKDAYCKPGCMANARTVFRYPINQKDKKRYGHPTIKPLPIIERIVLNSSRPGDVVLHPFMGSGTTGVAAARNGRSFIGCEIDGRYFDTARGRINDSLALFNDSMAPLACNSLNICLQIKKNGLDLRCGVACATGDVGRFPSFRRHPEYRGEQGGRLLICR